MGKVETATKWMEALAADNTHGYDQVYRWGQMGDYDCSSAVITAWETAGVPLKTKGATYTGNLRAVALACGFTDVTSKVNVKTGAGLIRGDILLNTVHHVAMFVGNGKEVEASINEKGTARGGNPGDQTGREILVRAYRNYPWNYVLRYPESTSATATTTTTAKKTTSKKALQAAMYYDKAIAGTYHCNVDSLNVRTGAGTNYESVGQINKGTAIQFYGYYNKKNGVEWWLVVAGGMTGYICTSGSGKSYVVR